MKTDASIAINDLNAMTIGGQHYTVASSTPFTNAQFCVHQFDFNSKNNSSSQLPRQFALSNLNLISLTFYIRWTTNNMHI